MLIKVSVILTLLQFGCAQDKNLIWDLAVVVDNQIKLLYSNGTEIETRDQPFSDLKALAYDNVRDQFVVSDMHNKNDTVYTVKITKDVTVPIIQGLPGDVQGLAVDPINDILYWTDGINSAIYYVPLNESFSEFKKIVLKDSVPHTLAIDVCKRYIYWTSPQNSPTVERAKLDGSNQEIFIDHLMMTPEGLAIDYKAQKLYWADSRVGTAGGKIESIHLDGTDRKTVIERNTMEPYALAVDENAIYFTDTNNNGLYKFMKGSKANEAPEKLVMFEKMPMGLVANNNIIKEEPDCKDLENAIRTYKEVEVAMEDVTYPPAKSEEDQIRECLNGGELSAKHCKCTRGFSGKYCENSMCQNLCVNGDCYMSSVGKPMCRCDRGYVGNRCQKHRCDGYCLNDGDCSTYSASNIPRCRCQEGFIGERCEYNIGLCDIYCSDDGNSFYSEKYETLCRCGDPNFYSKRNLTSTALRASTDQPNFLTKLNDPVIYLSVIVLFCLVAIVALILYVRIIQKRRPRIKKRIIVNKNVTPLTYRPQPTTEQCEITIENCCNMNVCETPCFEPRGEDKKKLLTNMEGEDLY